VLSDLDRQIARQLQATPRGSVASIAATLGQPEHVVRAVFDRLTRSGALKVFAIVDPSVFGRPLVVGIRLSVEYDVLIYSVRIMLLELADSDDRKRQSLAIAARGPFAAGADDVAVGQYGRAQRLHEGGEVDRGHRLSTTALKIRNRDNHQAAPS